MAYTKEVRKKDSTFQTKWCLFLCDSEKNHLEIAFVWFGGRKDHSIIYGTAVE